MAKAARAFQMPEEDRDEVLIAPRAPASAPNSDQEIAGVGTKTTMVAAPQPVARPAYREGRRNLSVWLDAKAFNSFKAMVAQEGGTISDYVIDMINREFARKGLPQIAKK